MSVSDDSRSRSGAEPSHAYYGVKTAGAWNFRGLIGRFLPKAPDLSRTIRYDSLASARNRFLSRPAPGRLANYATAALATGGPALSYRELSNGDAYRANAPSAPIRPSPPPAAPSAAYSSGLLMAKKKDLGPAAMGGYNALQASRR